MARSPLTEKFLRIVALRDEVKTWPQDEQDFFLDMLAPEPEPAKKPQKKSSKKPAGKGGGGKSARGESLKGQLDKTLQGQRKATADDDSDGPCLHCGMDADHNSHHKKTDLGYHPFVPSSDVQPADNQSSASSAATGSTASSEDPMGNALDAARAAAGE